MKNVCIEILMIYWKRKGLVGLFEERRKMCIKWCKDVKVIIILGENRYKVWIKYLGMIIYVVFIENCEAFNFC